LAWFALVPSFHPPTRSPPLRTVPYRARYKGVDGAPDREELIDNVAKWPADATLGRSAGAARPTILEPLVEATIITPASSLGALLEEMRVRRGEQLEVRYLDADRVLLRHRVPWGEVVSDFNDTVLSLSAGFASLEFTDAGYAPADLAKVDILLNGEVAHALAFVCHRDNAMAAGRRVCESLKVHINRQQFAINLQAKVGAKVLSSVRIAPYRKDVLTTKAGKAVGGGDISRKKKVLEKQKRGKARQRAVGKVPLSQAAFLAAIRR